MFDFFKRKKPEPKKTVPIVETEPFSDSYIIVVTVSVGARLPASIVQMMRDRQYKAICEAMENSEPISDPRVSEQITLNGAYTCESHLIRAK